LNFKVHNFKEVLISNSGLTKKVFSVNFCRNGFMKLAPAVHLHPVDRGLPVAAHRRRLLPLHRLEEDERKGGKHSNCVFFVALPFQLLHLQRRTDVAFCFMPGVKHQSRLMPFALAPQLKIAISDQSM
jgi:hypothetical protein